MPQSHPYRIPLKTDAAWVAGIVAVLVAGAAQGTGGKPVDERCAKIERRIEWLTSRLRAGYRNKAGERWKEELRRLKLERRRRCR